MLWVILGRMSASTFLESEMDTLFKTKDNDKKRQNITDIFPSQFRNRPAQGKTYRHIVHFVTFC